MATVTRYTALITTVDPSNGVVGFVTKGDAQERRAIVLTTAVASRWPIEGETWLVRQENGSWYIDQPLPSTSSYEGVTPGDAIINSPTGRVHVLGSDDGSTDFSFTGSDPAGGDLSGNYPNPSVQTVLNGIGAPAVSQDVLQNGVIGAGDFAVSGISVNGATGAITCTVAAGVAWVKDTNGLLRRVMRGGYGTVTLTLPSPPPANNTYIYVLQVDTNGVLSIGSSHGGSGVNNLLINLGAGTYSPDAGHLGIAVFAIYNFGGTYYFSNGSGTGTVGTATATQGTNWLDRRPWAQGASYINNGTNSTNYTTSSNGWVTVLQCRLESHGGPLFMQFTGSFYGTTNYVQIGLFTDNSWVNAGYGGYPQGGTQAWQSFSIVAWTQPTAGSHMYYGVFSCPSGGVSNILNGGGYIPTLTVQEVNRANNGTI